MTAVTQHIVAEQGAVLQVALIGASASLSGRTLVMHVRAYKGSITTKLVASTTDSRLTIDGTPFLSATLLIPSDVMAAVSVTKNTEFWFYDVESYTNTTDVRREWEGTFQITRDVTRASEADLEDRLAGLVRYDSPQNLTTAQKLEARTNIGAGTGGGGTGDVVGPASATDSRIAEFDGVTGKLLKQSSYTITSLLAAAWARASHTGTQIAATISDFASAAVAAVTWSTLTGKPSTFDPSAHKTSHATGGGDALTASDIGAQPLAAVLTNTTAAFTTAQETKLSGIEASADVTDAGNVGTAIDGATAKTTPVDADAVPLIDSAASNALKKLSWANIKATAKTYFDTLYQAILVSGTNIKTINATSLLGSGDIAISTSPGGSTTQPQYNNAGAFAGMSGVAWDDTNRAETRTGATVTASKPIFDLTQTWNNAAVSFTAEKTNVTNTASLYPSLLRDWQVGGVSKARISLEGAVIAGNVGFTGITNPGDWNKIYGTGNHYIVIKTYAADMLAVSGQMLRVSMPSNAVFGWASGIDPTAGPDTGMRRNAAGVIEINNNTTNTYRDLRLRNLFSYGTYTDESNYVRASLAATSTIVTLAAETAGTGADNIGVAISPTGTGALSAHVPDSGTGGGNARGANAVDWVNVARGAATMVASGQYSTISGGGNNTASGANSSVGGGITNAATGTSSHVGGGTSNTASNTGAVVSGGSTGTASGDSAVVGGGYSNTASGGAASVLGGQENVASGLFSWVPGGYQATTRGIAGVYAYSSGKRSAVGDAQVIGQPVRQTTSSTSLTYLTTDAAAVSATNCMILPINSGCQFEARVTAVHAAGAAVGGWKIEGMARRGASGDATVVGVTVTAFTADAAIGAPTVTVAANAGGAGAGGIVIAITPANATTTYWVGKIELIQAA